MRTLNLDESGDANLRQIDSAYPVFVLGGVILDDDYARARADEVITALKRDLFGRTDFVLHTAEITRSTGVYKRLRNKSFRRQFYERLNATLRDLDFSVIACVIRKDRIDQDTAASLQDPYCDALERLIVRFGEIIGNRGNGGRIRAERLHPVVDRRGLRRWDTLREFGAGELSGSAIRHRIASLSFHDKSERLIGLELADLVVTPIGRHVAGQADLPDWEVVREKLHGGNEAAIEIIPANE